MIAAPLEWRDWLEVAYWIAGIVIAASVVAVFRQVQLAKTALEATREESELRSEREAIILAAQQCERYAERVIPLSDKVYDEFTQAGVSTDEWTLADDAFGPESIPDDGAVGKWLAEYRKIPDDSLYTLFNEMEAFSIYFAKGAADESVAFSAIGPVFCADVRRYAPALVDCRRQASEGGSMGAFENTIDLYRIWSSRTRQNTLRMQALLAAAEAERVHVPQMPAIGTKASREKYRRGKPTS